MLGDEEIKESSLMRPGDEIIRFDIQLFPETKGRLDHIDLYLFCSFYLTIVICCSIHEVCLTDKFYKKDLGFGNEALFTTSSKNEVSFQIYNAYRIL